MHTEETPSLILLLLQLSTHKMAHTVQYLHSEGSADSEALPLPISYL